jgi:hypothetical protein
MTHFDQRHQQVGTQYNVGRDINIHQHIAFDPGKAAQEKQNRSRMLERVQAFWITGVLEQSLQGVALIALGMQKQPDVVINPWRLVMQEVDQPPHTLPGSGSYENGSSFKVVTMEKKTQTSIMHIKRF